MADFGGPMGWTVDPESLTALRLDKAVTALDAGDARRALVEAEELLQQYPHHAEALALAGQAALRLGDAGMAHAALTRCIELLPGEAGLLEFAAVASFLLVDFAGAAESAAQALDLEPNRPVAWYYRGLALERLGDTEGARIAWARASELAPEEFPIPQDPPEDAWEPALAEALTELPPTVEAFYDSVPIEWRSFPDPALLARAMPPLSPVADALYLGEAPDDDEPPGRLPEKVLLFRGNLGRPPGDHVDLVVRIARALVHEAADWLGLSEVEEEPSDEDDGDLLSNEE